MMRVTIGPILIVGVAIAIGVVGHITWQKMRANS